MQLLDIIDSSVNG